MLDRKRSSLLEPYAGKLARTVLRGGWRGNALSLPGAVEYVEVPTRTVKPSQTCPGCGRQKKKALSQRTHSCECGLVLGRDAAAALVCVRWALTGAAHGREPAVCGAGTAPR
jgi:hypothetical protein